MKNPWIIIGIITVVLFGGAIMLSGKSVAENNEGVIISDNIKGSETVAITLIEFSDFACPACSSFQPILQEILTQFEGQLNLQYKHFPLPIPGHENAQPAAIAAEAAGQQGKFFEFHDILFDRQHEWVGAQVPGVFFVKYAEELGLDLELFRKHQKSSLLRTKVLDDFAEARTLELTGTPSFFINDERIVFDSIEEFVTKVAYAVDPVAAASSTGQVTPDSGSQVKFGF